MVAAYIEHIGIYFFFVACAGVSIVVWVFNWICWYNQCCCCDFLHNPVNKRLVWWTSFTFLLGILACCISGFVTTNRFGFALEGAWCAFDRFYYDSLHGQLKNTNPKWVGFENIKKNLTKLEDCYEELVKSFDLKQFLTITTSGQDGKEIEMKMIRSNKDYHYDGYFLEDYLEEIDNFNKEGDNLGFYKKMNKIILPLSSRYGKIIDSLYILQNLEKDIEIETNSNKKDFKTFQDYMDELGKDFSDLKSELLNDAYYFARVGRGWGKVLTMIYLCLLCITITFAGVAMMFYACLKRQGYLQTFMHVLWNIVRFFMFSFFFYGAAYGMCYLALRDAVAFVMFIFGNDNLNDANPQLIPKNQGKDFLKKCLLTNNYNYKNEINPFLTSAFQDFFQNLNELHDLFQDQTDQNDFINSFDGKGQKLFEHETKMYTFINGKATNIYNFFSNHDLWKDFLVASKRQGGLFGDLDCSFLKSDLAMIYRTLYDLNVEARILCALSCCIAFFGAVFVYFFLLVLHHYNTELFFDNGKSIFFGFEGFGPRKTNKNDPSQKKRKIRAEIELSSRNEDYQKL